MPDFSKGTRSWPAPLKLSQIFSSNIVDRILQDLERTMNDANRETASRNTEAELPGQSGSGFVVQNAGDHDPTRFVVQVPGAIP